MLLQAEVITMGKRPYNLNRVPLPSSKSNQQRNRNNTLGRMNDPKSSPLIAAASTKLDKSKRMALIQSIVTNDSVYRELVHR